MKKSQQPQITFSLPNEKLKAINFALTPGRTGWVRHVGFVDRNLGIFYIGWTQDRLGSVEPSEVGTRGAIAHRHPPDHLR